MPNAIRVVVTGCTGQVAYALLPRIAAGEMFGPQQPLVLQLFDIPAMQKRLRGVAMELEDCAFPLVQNVVATVDRNVAFRDANWALLVGSKPRGPGMERRDLLRDNGAIFVDDGRAIDAVAADDVRVVVVGNPCNSNCLVAASQARRVPRDRFSGMTRLDENRARSLLARRARAHVTDVRRLVIWGNHSSTLYPDFTNATVRGRPATEAVGDRNWLETEFLTAVQQRGAAIIAARGASSAFSAAQAVVDHVRSLRQPTADDDWFSAGVVSDGSYDVPEGLVSSFPLRASGGGTYQIVQGVRLDDFARHKIRVSIEELLAERSEVEHLLQD